MFEYYDVKSQEWVIDAILEENIDEILKNLFRNLLEEGTSNGCNYS